MTPADALADLLLTFGARHPEDQPALESVALRLRRGDAKAVRDLGGVLTEEDAREASAVASELLGIKTTIRPASRQKRGVKRAARLRALQELGL